MKLSNPWPKGYTINKRSPYGWRTLHGKRRFHHGVDVAGSFEALVAADGVVSHIGWSRWGGGHVVKVDHGDFVSVYYHGADETNLMRGERVFPGRWFIRRVIRAVVLVSICIMNCANVAEFGVTRWTLYRF